MFPIVWIILTSFREGGAFVPYIIPKTFTLENYKVLLTNQTGNFPLSFGFEHLVRLHRKLSVVINFYYNRNGLCAVTVAFPLKKTILKVALVLNMFPGFMSMIAVYYILKALNLTESLFALILVYSAGSALGFTSPKGSSIPFRWL